MKKVKITVMRQASYTDLMEKYEMPMAHACDHHVGEVFVSDGYHRPDGFCESAWGNLFPYVMALGAGGADFFNGWMKDKNTAMISCNDGFRPTSFLLEAVSEDGNV